MKTNEIKAWLAVHEVKQRDIARACNLAASTVCGFINGRGVSAPLYRYFVNVLGVPRAYFEDRYKGEEEEAA